MIVSNRCNTLQYNGSSSSSPLHPARFFYTYPLHCLPIPVRTRVAYAAQKHQFAMCGTGKIHLIERECCYSIAVSPSRELFFLHRLPYFIPADK